ncbi:MAG: hypothetical protein WCK63_09230 [Betaproteobacteria bacterium]
MIFRSLFFILMLLVSTAWAEDTVDGEDFEETEEGMKFDIPRYGLQFRRNLYLEGDDITKLAPNPTAYNDTRDVGRWKPYVSHWNYEPPGFIVVYINDDSPHLMTTETLVNLVVTIASLDRAGNQVPAATVNRERVPLKPGMNRIPINIHVNPGDFLSVRIKDVVQSIPIKELDVAD